MESWVRGRHPWCEPEWAWAWASKPRVYTLRVRVNPLAAAWKGGTGSLPGGRRGWHAGEEIKRKGNTGSMWEASTVSAEDKAKELNLHGHEHCDNCCPLLSQSDRALCRREAFYGPSSQAQTWTCRLPLICHQAARVRRLSSPASLRSPRLPEYSGMFVERVYKVYSMKRRESGTLGSPGCISPMAIQAGWVARPGLACTQRVMTVKWAGRDGWQVRQLHSRTQLDCT